MYRHLFLPILVLLFLTSTAMAAGEKLALVGSGAPGSEGQSPYRIS